MKKNYINTLIAFAMIVSTMHMTKAQTADVYNFDFNQLPTGQYNRDQVEDALGVSFCKGADEGRVSIKSFPNQGNALRILYPQGKVKTGESGIHTKVPLNSGQFHEELYISYLVYFPEDFEFRAGGKLPGLAYQTSSRNMSLRLMWRKDGLVETYVHYNTKPTRPNYKSSINWSLIDPIEEPNNAPQPDQVKFTRGTWHHVEMYHKLNTPGQNDGIMKGWLDGKLALNITDAQDYRQSDEGDIGMNTIYLSSFFGGSDESFQPTKDVYARFDDFKVSTTRIGPPSGIENNSNVFPSVSITSPTNNTTVNAGDNVQVSVTASDTDGSVSSVALFNGSTQLGVTSSLPYNFTIDNISEGTYNLTAVVTDNENAQTTSSSIELIAQAVSNEVDKACAFNTPRATALPAYAGVTFNNVYVLGTGGPDASNIRKFKVKWVPSANGLYAFSMNTRNGQPSSYIDLRGASNARFNTSEPEVSIAGSGFPGLDGDYWVTDDNGNFVMVSKKGNHTIYCSNSTVEPSCESATRSAFINTIDTVEKTENIVLYPNPVEDVLYIQSSNDIVTFDVYDITGKLLVHKENIENNSVSLAQFDRGIYFVKAITSKGNSLTEKIVKR